MKKTIHLGARGKRLLRLLVKQIKRGRFQKNQPLTFITYSEILKLLGLPKPHIFPGRRLQPRGLNELNEWTIDTPKIPKVTGLIIDKKRHLPGKGYAHSHSFGKNWRRRWLEETAKAIKFNWSRYL